MKPGEDRTKFEIVSSSYPQYMPYYFERSLWAHNRKKQRTYKHQYDVTIQVDSLSIDDDRFTCVPGLMPSGILVPRARASGLGLGDRNAFHEGTNITRGVNGDFFLQVQLVVPAERTPVRKKFHQWSSPEDQP